MPKECNYIFLPTEQVSPIGFDEQGNVRSATEFGFSLFDTQRNFQHKPVHLYILSDDEIKGGDWVLHESHGIKRVLLCEKIVGKSIVTKKGDSSCWIDYCKKIISTTNPQLCIMKPILKKEIGSSDMVGECKINTYGDAVPSISESDIEYFISLYNGKGKEIDIWGDMRNMGFTSDQCSEISDYIKRNFMTKLHSKNDTIMVEYEELCIQTGQPCGFPCIGECHEISVKKPKIEDGKIVIIKP